MTPLGKVVIGLVLVLILALAISIGELYYYKVRYEKLDTLVLIHDLQCQKKDCKIR